MVNKVTLIGHLGKDPDIRTLENGTKVGTFTMATSESYKDKTDTWQNLTEWHNVVVWRYLAEKAERELKKGGLVYVEGKITHRKYQDKEGQERSISEVVASTVNSLERRDSKQSGGGNFPGSDDDPFNKQSLPSNDSQEENDDLPF